MGAIHVLELMSLDGVIDTPTWTADFEYLSCMGEIIGTEAAPLCLTLAAAEQFGHGVVYLNYRPNLEATSKGAKDAASRV